MLKALRPVIVKEFRQISRDPTSLGMLLFLPAALIVFIGYALNYDFKQIPIAILQQINSAQSRGFTQIFRPTEIF